MKLLHVADSHIGEQPYAVERLGLDLRAGLERAVQAAIDHDVDVFLHAGKIAKDTNAANDNRAFIEHLLGRLHAHDIAPVLYDELGELQRFDGRILHAANTIDVEGVRIRGHRAPAEPWDGPEVVARHGAVTGLSGSGRHHCPIDPTELLATSAGITYVALGGLHACQPVQQSAYYSGATAPVWVYDRGTASGIVVELGVRTRSVLSLTRATWPARAHRSVTLDVGGMDVHLIGDALHRYLEAACSLDEACPTRPDLDERIAAIYPTAHERPGRGPICRPVVHLQVRNAPCSLDDALAARPHLDWLLNSGDHIFAQVDWEGEPRRRYVP